MAINRRLFTMGGCCLACGISGIESRARAQTDLIEQPFVCSTPDGVPHNDAAFQIRDYGASTNKFEIESGVRPFNITTYGTAFFKNRWLQTDGNTPNTGKITLGVFFIAGSSVQRDAVKKAAVAWTQTRVGQRINFDFAAPQPRSQIRISFMAGGGNHSQVGRECLATDLQKPTMNIQDAVDYVIQHEFGHVLGLLHEHAFPDNTIKWNEPVVIADLNKQGWSEQMVRDNILTKYPPDAIYVKDPRFNGKSIMLYPIAKRWTLDGFLTQMNKTIDQRDIQCLSGLYNF